MKFKIVITSLVLSTSLMLGNTIDNFGKIKPPTKEELKNFKNEFSHLNNNISDVKGFEKLLDKSRELIDPDTQLINSIDKYTGDDYMSKEEYTKLVHKVIKARDIVKRESVSEYIIYLTSETVPHSAHMDILHSVGVLQENGIRIKTKQYLIGIPEDFKKFMFDKRDYMMKMSEKEKGYVLKNFAIKLDPRMFENFNVDKVPAMVYGICKGKNPVKENCKFKYMIRGDSSMTNFFEKISEIEPKYKKYFNYLIANKIENNPEENKLLKQEMKRPLDMNSKNRWN